MRTEVFTAANRRFEPCGRLLCEWVEPQEGLSYTVKNPESRKIQIRYSVVTGFLSRFGLENWTQIPLDSAPRSSLSSWDHVLHGASSAHRILET